ncbi:CdiA family toxin C-terminal domain-containing protein [Brevibacillus sp. HB1.1]|uniref:CdiA family toxin C-terminal domain-containing protein n=1 Tax=Brevibacillus sp. HB1.1 TaxID=2738808 RepID=UPI0020C62715|nr:CdiA family toxin C-terminal domain-containing protein [Brevibacillus sp. HB1.1]
MQVTDGVMTYQDIQIVWSYGTIRLDRLEFVHQTGEHAKLRFTGIVPEEKEDEIIHRASSQDVIELCQKVGKQKKSIFIGRLHHVEIKVVRDVHYLTVEAVSHTYAMDMSVKMCSFQDESRLYSSIVDELVSKYPGGDMIDNAFDDLKQGKYIMQYEETDWVFLKRIASHVGAVLVPDVSANKVRFWVGLPEGRKQIKLKDRPYEVNQSIAPYRTYTFEHDDVLELGDEVLREGQTFAITKRIASMVDGLFRWTYVCATRKSVKQKKIYNKAIIGAAIDGKIIQIGRNQVKIHLTIDKTQDKSKAQWFPYGAEGNQILYLMPEIGSKVKLYFPGADEDDAMVINSVRHAPQGSFVEKNDKRMVDPGVKSFGNPQGKEFTMGDTELRMTAKEGALEISLSSLWGVSLNSTTNVNIHASGELNVNGAAVYMVGSEGMYLDTATDTIALVEENGTSSDQILLDAEKSQTFDPILSPFEKDMKSLGWQGAVDKRLADHDAAESKGEGEVVEETLSSLWNFAVDVADVAYTGVQLLASDEGETVTNIRGTEVKSLTEGNNLAKETEQKATSAAKYVGDVFQGEKSFVEIGQDIQAAGEKVGESVMQDYVIPVGMNWLHQFEDKHGGKEAKLKRTLEESYQRGRNTGRVNVIGAEVIVSGLSGGMGGAAMKTVTTAAKLTPDGPKRDRTPDGNGSDGSNGSNGSNRSDGNETPLFGLFDSIKKDMETLDGKFKTKAKTVEDALKEMQEMVNSFLAAMQGFSNLVPNTGRPMFFSVDGNGGGGHNNNHGNNRNNKRDNEGTGNLKYKEGYYVEHLTGEVTKCTDWKGVSGGHNYEEFKKFFDTNGKYGYEEIGRKEHPDIQGIYDIEYRLKVEVKNYQGKGTGEYKVVPKEDKPPLKKTIYDPNVISNDDIVRLGKEAMEEGIKSQRVNQLKSQTNKQKIQGVSSNGLKFEGIKNTDTGEIENFYPVLKFEEN